ncbi:MAG: lipocalin-like domain-containing protein [Thermoanaerobaculia bacterium]
MSVALAAGAVAGCSERQPHTDAAGSLSVATALGVPSATDLRSFARALEPRELVFPTDHGPHPEFKTEWWYWIGNVATADGRRFGYQLTIFRSALTPETPRLETAAPAGESTWKTNQLYMAHFALSDIDGEGSAFHSFERFARGAFGLAGARPDPFRVWLETWSVEEADGAWKLSARADDIALELALRPGKNRVLHGDRGLSRKGDAAGAASYYYSRSRMPTRGRLEIAEREYPVAGDSWFDREWSTSLLAEDEVGWDWLGAQLEDGREVMFFRLRRRDGSSARVDGTVVDAEGTFRPLRTAGFELVPRGLWTSPETGIAYPAGFLLDLPAEALELEVRPLLAGQELRHSFVYWEGAVEIAGSAPGRGFLEMTGYGERASPR